MVVSHINGDFEFVHMLKEFELENDEVAVSFDVVSQYTSVPVEDSMHYLNSV